MPVITINGLIGSGAPEIGAEVARKLGIDYVDRLILAEAAKKMGSTVAAVAEQAERPLGLGDKLAGFFRNVLERSALAGSGADPYFGGGMDMLLVREYRDIPEVPPGEVNDQQLLAVTAAVITEIAQSERCVIMGRGANLLLRDWPGALHVGTIAGFEERVQRIDEREHLGQAEAERYVVENDRGRVNYFKRFFGIDPQDPELYHLMLSTERLDIARAAEMVLAANALVSRSA